VDSAEVVRFHFRAACGCRVRCSDDRLFVAFFVFGDVAVAHAGALQCIGANVFGATPAVLQTQLSSPMASPWLSQICADSTKRKRARKMNKHKYRKLRKKLRFVTKINIKST
jgi:hypothetical protein